MRSLFEGFAKQADIKVRHFCSQYIFSIRTLDAFFWWWIWDYRIHWLGSAPLFDFGLYNGLHCCLFLPLPHPFSASTDSPLIRPFVISLFRINGFCFGLVNFSSLSFNFSLVKICLRLRLLVAIFNLDTFVKETFWKSFIEIQYNICEVANCKFSSFDSFFS